MASAKLAKSTVTHSQRVICRLKPKPARWLMVLSMSSAEVSTAPTSTTNITGFLIMPRGSSLRNESTSAWAMISVFQRLFFSSMSVRDPSGAKAPHVFARPRGVPKGTPFQNFVVRVSLEKLSCLKQQVFQNWPQAQRREEG